MRRRTRRYGPASRSRRRATARCGRRSRTESRRARLHPRRSSCRSPSPPVVVVAADDRDVGIEQLADLRRDGIEDLGRRRVAGDQRRDAPQRRLLVREAGQTVAGCRVRDRGRDQFGEVNETELRPGRKRLLAIGPRDQRPTDGRRRRWARRPLTAFRRLRRSTPRSRDRLSSCRSAGRRVRRPSRRPCRAGSKPAADEDVGDPSTTSDPSCSSVRFRSLADRSHLRLLVRPGEQRTTPTSFVSTSRRKSRSTSTLTAAKIAAGAASCATSVATRRSAACSAATSSSASRARETASRDSAFAMAVATSWENAREAVLRFVRQTLAGRKDRDRAPQPILDENRVADGRDDADALRGLGGGAAAGRPVERVHAGGASGAVDLERGHPLLELPARPDRYVVAGRDADGDDPQSVLLEPQDEAAGGEELRHLIAQGREDLVRRHALRDQCCEPQERGLLVGRVARARPACSSASSVSAWRRSSSMVLLNAILLREDRSRSRRAPRSATSAAPGRARRHREAMDTPQHEHMAANLPGQAGRDTELREDEPCHRG